MKCSFGISNFLEEISSLSHSVLSHFFALITEEGFLISSCYSLELCIQMLISFLFASAFRLSSFHSYFMASPDSHFAFLHFFSVGMVLVPVPCTVSGASVLSPSGPPWLRLVIITMCHWFQSAHIFPYVFMEETGLLFSFLLVSTWGFDRKATLVPKWVWTPFFLFYSLDWFVQDQCYFSLKFLNTSITIWDVGCLVTDFIFLGSKITADGDCSHVIKRCLLLGRKVMTNLDSILKSRDITLPTKVHLVKAMVFPVVMHACESWTIKKADHQRIDAFELWCWRRLLRVPWTARRSNQSILKEISPE